MGCLPGLCGEPSGVIISAVGLHSLELSPCGGLLAINANSACKYVPYCHTYTGPYYCSLFTYSPRSIQTLIRTLYK